MSIQLELDKLQRKSTRNYSGNSIPVGSPLGRILISSSGSIDIANAIRKSKSKDSTIKIRLSAEDSKTIIDKINKGK